MVAVLGALLYIIALDATARPHSGQPLNSWLNSYTTKESHSIMETDSCLGTSRLRNHHRGSVDHSEVPLSGMQVVLRHAGIDLFYAGRKHWVGKPDFALDLETIEHATELSRDESFEEMDIVVTYDDPTRELVLPVRRKRAADAESLSTVA